MERKAPEFPYQNFTFNTTSNKTNQKYNPKSDELFVLFRLINVSLYSSIIFFGITGNCLIIAAVIRSKKLRTPCNILISNISAVDILYLVIAGSLRIIEWYDPWPFGKTACAVISPLQDVLVCVSVVSHTSIAWERQRALVTPFKRKITYKESAIVLIAIWPGCYIVTGLPVALVYKLIPIKGVLYCFPMWSKLFETIYLISLVSIFVVAQVIIQSIAYIRIVTVLRLHDNVNACTGESRVESVSHSRERPRMRSFDSKSSTISSQAWVARRKRKEKLIKMLFIQLLTFQFCWMFRSTVIVIELFWFRTNYYVRWVSALLFYVQQVINPLILFSMSSDFRRATKKNCCKICDLYRRSTGKKEAYVLRNVKLRSKTFNQDPLL